MPSPSPQRMVPAWGGVGGGKPLRGFLQGSLTRCRVMTRKADMGIGYIHICIYIYLYTYIYIYKNLGDESMQHSPTAQTRRPKNDILFRQLWFCQQCVFICVCILYEYFRKHQIDAERQGIQNGGCILS